MPEFVAKLTRVQASESKKDDHNIDVRFSLECHDPLDPGDLIDLVGAELVVTFEPAPLPLLPMEEAIAQRSNGRH